MNTLKWALPLVIILIAAFASPSPTPVPEEEQAINEAYDRAIQVLYRHIYDTLVTNPPGDEKDAASRFKKGLEAARRARRIALDNVQ